MRGTFIYTLNGVQRVKSEIVADGADQIELLGQPMVDGNAMVLNITVEVRHPMALWKRILYLFFPNRVTFDLYVDAKP